MTTPDTLVSIYRLDESGATGARCGSGTLIDATLVLVHPPLSEQLHGNTDSVGLRVGISSTAREPGIVEVIDVVSVHVSASGSAPLVALALLRPATSPTEPIPPDGDDSDLLAERLVQHLGSLPDPHPLSEVEERVNPSEPPVEHSGNKLFGPPYCGIWPNAPGCRN